MNKIKILLTGGSGFIGTNVCDWMIMNNMEFINIDINQPCPHHVQTKPFFKYILMVEVEILDLLVL